VTDSALATPAADADPLCGLAARLAAAPAGLVHGRVTKAVGTMIEASGLIAGIGEICEIAGAAPQPLAAEVIGFVRGSTLLAPMGPVDGLVAQADVVSTGRGARFPVGAALLGRVLDPDGRPLDGLGPLPGCRPAPIQRDPPPPLARRPIAKALPTGVRSLDAFLTLGQGQRIGIFAPPGAGKSTLLGMIARHSEADVVVVGLVGERGREVEEFLHHAIGTAHRARSVLVVATSDRPPMERIRCAWAATTIAEHFRDQGRHVLLLMDSLTRFARAQREIGLACGEPPTRRSYPPSVFAMLPRLLERAGQGASGSITAVYTVLTEGEDDNDPIAEELRSLLDGHVMLTRKLAGAGQHPAVDVLGSISRAMPRVADDRHQRAATRLRALMAQWQEIEMLVQIGEYKPGVDPQADAAVRLRRPLQAFLRQPADEAVPWPAAMQQLQALAAAFAPE